MFRLLGILTLSELLLGGRHRRHSLGRGLLFGALLGYLANRDFDMDRVKRDAGKAAKEARKTAHEVRKATREARKAAHEALKAAKHEIRDARRAERDLRVKEHLDAIHAELAARKAAREEGKTVRGSGDTEASAEIRGLPEYGINEALEIQELEKDMERNTKTAAMAADVPMIQFPEEDEKYHASRKYGYA